MAAPDEQTGFFRKLGKRSIIPLVALVLLGATYFLWPLDRVGTIEPCVGTHLFTRATLGDDGRLYLRARTGYRPRQLTIGPNCPSFRPEFDVTSADNMKQICVGDSVARFGANVEPDQCVIREIRVIRQIQ